MNAIIKLYGIDFWKSFRENLRLFSFVKQYLRHHVWQILKFQMLNIGKPIDKNILILGANNEHFINYHLVKDEIDVLANAPYINII